MTPSSWRPGDVVTGSTGGHRFEITDAHGRLVGYGPWRANPMTATKDLLRKQWDPNGTPALIAEMV